jgi:hypothetical protein
MTYRGRSAASIENDQVRVTVLKEGGHIAEILHKATGVNPLWTPPWTSIEPSAYRPELHPEYGSGIDAKLLAGIMGHNLCLDIFGEPSEAEVVAGLGVHGEGPVAAYEIQQSGYGLTMRACLPVAQIRFERTLELHGDTVEIHEAVESLAAFDRPIGWTQHVTLGPPFLECGVTKFRTSATRSKVFEGTFGTSDYLESGAVFDWPAAPCMGSGFADLSVFNGVAVSSAFTAHLMDPQRPDAFFSAFHPGLKLSFGYSWNPADFPWLGIWEENRSRSQAPWNGNTVARGMEFGVSPMPESRRRMVERGTLFGVPAYRWLPAHGRIMAAYSASFTAHD